MKLLRRILLGIAALALLFAIVIALAFTSGVQTWAARRVVAGQPGLKAEIGKVDVGLKHVQVEGVRFEQPGIKLTLPSASVDVPLVSAARSKVHIRRLVARGWTVELTGGAEQPAPSAAPTGAAAAPASQQPAADAKAAAVQAFDGIFKLMKLPVDLSLDEADIEGEVVLPGKPGAPAGRVKVKVSGGQLGVGREGRFTLGAGVVLADTEAPVSQLETTCVLTVRMDTPRSLERVGGAIEAKATGRQFPQGTSVSASFDLSGGPRGEAYSLVVQGAGRDRKLLDVSVSLPAGAVALSGRWRVDVGHADVAPFALGWTLPVFALSGEGTFELARTFDTLRASGRFDSKCEQLEVFMPELKVLGRIASQVDFDVSKEGDVARIDRLSGAISGAKPIASLQALQRIEFNLATRELKTAAPGAELVRITLHGVPLAWAQPFLKDIVVTGDDVRGEFFASARANSGFAVRPSAPVTVTNLSVSQAGKPLVKGLDVSVRMSGDYTTHGWQGDVSELAIRSGGAQMFLMSVKAGQAAGPKEPVKATGRYEADLSPLLAQPVLAGLTALTQGVVRGEFSASVDSICQAMARIELVGAAAGTKEIPKVAADLRVDLQKDGSIEAVVPVVIEAAGRKSDLELSARVKTGAGSTSLDAELRSNCLYIPDLQLFQAAVAQTTPSAAPEAQPAPVAAKAAKPAAKAAAPVADKVPFWNAISGQFRVALKEVVYSNDLKVSNVTGTVKVDAGAIVLDALRAKLGADSEVAVNGRMAFDAKAAEPYSYTGDTNVTNFDPVPYFRALAPEREPTVEGLFNVTIRVSGTSTDLSGLAGKLKAEATLTSKSGIFRGLALPSSFSDRFQTKSGNLLSNLGGMVGALAGGSKAGDTAAVGLELVSLLAEPRYDQLNVQMHHDAGASTTKIDDFALISPKFRLNGSGSILMQEGVPFLKQPLTAVLEMSVHGETANALRRQNLLKGDADSLGYSPLFSPVKVDGSLSEVGTQALANMLMKQLLSSATGPLGNLFGK